MNEVKFKEVIPAGQFRCHICGDHFYEDEMIRDHYGKLWCPDCSREAEECGA